MVIMYVSNKKINDIVIVAIAVNNFCMHVCIILIL